MIGLRRLFYIGLWFVAVWRGEHHAELAKRWRDRAFRFNKKSEN